MERPPSSHEDEMRLPALLPATLLLLPATVALAWNEADLGRLRQTLACEACDLDGALLGGTDMTGAKLAGANLSHTFIRFQTLNGADFTGARFEDAFFLESTVVGATFTGAAMPLIGFENSTLRDSTSPAPRWPARRRRTPISAT